MITAAQKTKERGPVGHKNRSGRLLASDVLARANPVRAEDIIEEKTELDTRIILDADYVRFFSENDDLLKTLLSVVNNSPTCRSIIQQKVALVMGDGLVALQGRPNSLFASLAKAAVPVTDEAQLTALDEQLQSVNSDGESLLDVLQKAASDYEWFGNCYVGMSKGKDGAVYAYHLPFTNGRLKRRDDEGNITHIGFADDWKNWNSNKAEDSALFPKWEADKEGVERTVIHIANYAPGFDYYGLPDYVAAMFFCTLEYYIGRRNQSRLENNNIPSGILQFFGATSAEEAKKIVKDAKERFVGIGKNGGLLVQVLSDERLKAEFVKIEESALEGELLDLMAVCAQAIITAHRWTTSLAGIATAGKLGTNQSLIQEFQYVQNTVIRPTQNALLRGFVNRYVKLLQGDKGKIYLDICNATPVSFFGSLKVGEVLTDDEQRSQMGFEPTPATAEPATPNPETN